MGADGPVADEQKDLEFETVSFGESGARIENDLVAKPVPPRNTEGKFTRTNASPEPPAEPESPPAEEPPKDAPAEAAAAPEGDGGAPEAPAEEPKKRRNPHTDPRARMLQATQQLAEAHRDIAARDRRIAELQQGAPQPQQPKGPQNTTPDDHETYEKYMDERIDYKVAQSQQVERQAQAHAQQEQRYVSAVTQAATESDKAFSEAETKDPAYWDGIDPELRQALVPSFALQGQRPGPYNAIADVVVRSRENGPRVLRYLSDHVDETRRLASLSPYDLIREMARIEARMDAATTGTAPRVTSQAKPPVTPVTGSPQSADPFAVDDNMSLEEHIKRMNARDDARVRGRQ